MDEPRIRSPGVRMLLGDQAAVGARLADYAVMSAYAYVEDKNCGNTAKLDPGVVDALGRKLRASQWERVTAAEFVPPCEDELGLFYQVWKRETAASVEVVMAFRGTLDFKDWWYGNLYWFRRFFTDNHQYARAREHSEKVIRFFESHKTAQKALKFYATGHSLGGGLAQAVLYERPDKFIQAYAFDPSSATAFTSRTDKTPFAPCACDAGDPEPRIYRIYESYEILSNLRIVHKFFFAPDAWVNEVRFNYARGNLVAQHSMARLALTLAEKQSSAPAASYARPWYSAKVAECTGKFLASLQQACSAGGRFICPAGALPEKAASGPR